MSIKTAHTLYHDNGPLKKAAEADLRDAPQPPFPRPTPKPGKYRPGNEVATTTESALIAQEEDEDVHGMDGMPTRKSTRSRKQVKDNNFVFER